MGMADGRCFQIGTSNGLLNDYLMTQNGISYEDNYRYRQLLQQRGPEVLDQLMNKQQCDECNTVCYEPILKMPDIY
jgi:hypothetical protein